MSNDLKEFLEKEQKSGIVNVNKLGLFFWERGGKQFAEAVIVSNFKQKIELARENIEARYQLFNYKSIWANEAQNFLDCVACLGGEKVKELIEELEGEGVSK